MTKVISLNAPLNTPFGKIKNINWNWKPPRKGVEYLPGTKKGEIKVEGNDKEIIIPIKIISPDDTIDATIDPLQGKKMTFWIKYWLLEHLGNCDTCLRYVIIHEFTHIIPQFQFPLPWELRGFEKEKKETMYKIHHYLVDSLVDRWNVKNKNYQYNDPIKFTHHIEQENKINLTSTTREELFENYIYVAKFTSHCDTWKKNLYNHTHQFPHTLRDKYHRLLDALSGVYIGPEFQIYELVRDIAELMLCSSKEDIIKRELKRRVYTLYDIGTFLFNKRNNNLRISMQQLWNKRVINIFQLRNCVFDWKRTFKRILNISSDELKYIDEYLSEPSDTNKFTLSYFIENQKHK